MKNSVKREMVDKFVRKEIDPIIRDVILDLICILSQKGHNIIKYITKVNNTRFIVYNNALYRGKTIDYDLDGKTKSLDIEWESFEGLYNPILDINNKNEIVLVEEICAINIGTCIKPSEQQFKQKVIHELLHLFSGTGLKVSDNDPNEMIFCTGFTKYTVFQEDGKLNMRHMRGNTEFNESVTEVIANALYNQIYDPNFFVLTQKRDGKYFPYMNNYYLITGFMRVVNLFTVKTSNIDILLGHYLRNDKDGYIAKVMNEIGVGEEILNGYCYYLTQLMSQYFGMDNKEFNMMFVKLTKTIFESMIQNFQSSIKITSENENVIYNYLNGVEDYLDYLFSYPIFKVLYFDYKTCYSKYKLI